MPFDQGTISFRICRLPEPMPKDSVERFAQFAAQGLDQVQDEPMWGWVSPRHLLDCNITEDTVKVAGYYHLCLRQAERKIPSSLLTAECRMVELTRMAEKDVDHLNKKERKTIKDEVHARLLPEMPPQLSGIYFAVDPNENLLYTTATSAHQMDLFLGFFTKAIGFEPIPLSPESAAAALFELDPAAVPNLSLSPEDNSAEPSGTLGQNFLTWLWQYQEERNGELPSSKLGDFSLFIDGPLTLVAEGSGAFETSIRKGIPTHAAEAKASLLVGKKLKRAKLVFARAQGEEWSCTLDADDFSFKGLKLPEGEALDPASIFEERMTNLFIFQSVFFALYQKFLAEMTDDEKQHQYLERAKAWIKDREAR